MNKKLKELEMNFTILKYQLHIDNISLIWPLKSILYRGYPQMNFLESKILLNLKKVLNILRFKNINIPKIPSNEIPIFFSDLVDFKYVYDLQTLTKVFENEYNYNIIKKLDTTPFEVLYYDFFNILSTKKVKQIASPRRIPAESFIDWKLVKEEQHLSSHISKRIKKLEDSGEVKLAPYITIKAIPEIIRWYLTWKKILLKFKDSPFLFLINEYSPFPYFGVVWAKKSGIPSIALQHGVIHPTHPGYYHDPENVAVNPDDYINHVIPTLTLVQGEYERRLLLKMGYPKKAIRVTGQPRYDFLAYSDDIFNRDKIIEEYGLPRNRRFIIWTTQTHGLSKRENIKNVQEILRAMKVLKDKYHLIIKLHPGENQKAPLYKKYFGDKDFATIIDGKANTYELIYISDALITKHSTTGIEAIAMGKPILLTEFIKSVDLSLYTDYGFDYILRSYRDLIEYVRLIKSGELLDDFERKRAFFIKERLAHFGNATQRVVKILEKFI